MNDRIVAIVLTHNSESDLNACLESLLAARQQGELDIVVVDNASRDRSVAIARAFTPQVTLIETGANLGYAAGNNRGLVPVLHGDRAPLAIAIINPDLRLPSSGLDSLVGLLHADPCIKVVSPAVVSGETERPSAPRPMLGIRRPTASTRAGHRIAEVDRLPGACMLIRPEVLAAIGLFDERFFLYYEELEFCARASRAGYRLHLCLDVVAQHAAGRAERPHRLYYLYRNQFLFARLAFPPRYAALYLARCQLYTLPKDLARSLIGRRPDLTQAILRGLLAGIRGETGRGRPPSLST
jgi:GT2 family glycosyltransferase